MTEIAKIAFGVILILFVFYWPAISFWLGDTIVDKLYGEGTDQNYIQNLRELFKIHLGALLLILVVSTEEIIVRGIQSLTRE